MAFDEVASMFDDVISLEIHAILKTFTIYVIPKILQGLLSNPIIDE